MALSNLFGWNNEAPTAACGSACGASDKRANQNPRMATAGNVSIGESNPIRFLEAELPRYLPKCSLMYKGIACAFYLRLAKALPLKTPSDFKPFTASSVKATPRG